MPVHRQTIFFTSKWSKEVEQQSSELCVNYPVKITIGSSDITINKDIAQNIEIINEFTKKRRIIDILRSCARSPKDRCQIFVKTKRAGDWLTRFQDQKGYYANALHGEKAQREREKILTEFKKAKRNVLVTTDVASKGLNLHNIKLVVNQDGG